MKASAIIPKPEAVGREALIVIGGALLAAFVMGRFPKLREWVKRQWDGAPQI